MKPLLMAPNLVDHYYRGGPKIAALRRIELASGTQPEEWLASTVSRAGAEQSGLARTIGGELLRDLVTADPVAFTGVDPSPLIERADVGLLVKLLDAGQRLPVHVHPDRAFARKHLDCPYGKTEAWLVLDATDDGAVYLGFTGDVEPRELARRRDAQDGPWMLAHMNRVEVSRGDGILVPAGTAHSIGEGVLVVEVQEPTDLSILLEWSITTSTREESHLGLGFESAMGALSHQALTPERLAELVVRNNLTGRLDEPQRLLPAEAAAFFLLDRLAPLPSNTLSVEAGFAVVIVLDGAGELSGSETIMVDAGDVYAVPYAFGDWSVSGDVSLLVCRPGEGWPQTLEMPS